MTKPHNNRVLGILTEILGWVLVALGIAALVLPGPGLLGLFAGMALLATRYEWAERRLEPVRKAAMKTARDSVSSWRNIVLSLIGVGLLVAAGITWGLQPAVPSWWPLADKLWLPGGWGTGGTLIGSAIIALAMIIYSYKNFRN
jgi:uncharacterized protein (TIGR02611 family)